MTVDCGDGLASVFVLRDIYLSSFNLPRLCYFKTTEERERLSCDLSTKLAS